MDKVKFNNNQIVLAEDLNDIVEYTNKDLIKRQQVLLGYSGGFNKSQNYSTGIIYRGGILLYDADKQFSNNSPLLCKKIDTNKLYINPGEAIDKNGNLIIVKSEIELLYNPNSWVENSINYVKLKYKTELTDQRYDDEGNLFYSREIESYSVIINNVPPSDDEILLATFELTSDKVINNLIDRRKFVRVLTTADAVFVDPSLRPSNNIITVEDHINCIGSASNWNPSNPHKQKLSDFEPDFIFLEGTTSPNFIIGYQPDEAIQEIKLIFKLQNSQGNIIYNGSVFNILKDNQFANIRINNLELQGNVIFNYNNNIAKINFNGNNFVLLKNNLLCDLETRKVKVNSDIDFSYYLNFGTLRYNDDIFSFLTFDYEIGIQKYTSIKVKSLLFNDNSNNNGEINYEQNKFIFKSNNFLTTIEAKNIKLEGLNELIGSQHPVFKGYNSLADDYHFHSNYLNFVDRVIIQNRGNVEQFLNVWHTIDYKKYNKSVSAYVNFLFRGTTYSNFGKDHVKFLISLRKGQNEFLYQVKDIYTENELIGVSGFAKLSFDTFIPLDYEYKIEIQYIPQTLELETLEITYIY